LTSAQAPALVAQAPALVSQALAPVAPLKPVRRRRTSKSISSFSMNSFIASLTAKNDEHLQLLRTILSTVQKDGQEVRDRLFNLERILHALCVHAGVQLVTLGLCVPAVPPFNAPSPSPSLASTSASSTISTTSSSSSAVHVPRMMYVGSVGDGPLRHATGSTFQHE
jgi:hypothetical protein